MNALQAYQVGGWVRDTLLGLPVQDRDWVVVGETPASMQARGFKQVGGGFPVFLHPVTHEEYALARQERKIGAGHRGFACETRQVTLEEDLSRRDLTINAMAMQEDGTLVDPFGGREDLQARLLRHVSPAFAEDPLRVLRVCRFHARFACLGFTIAPETLNLMQEMVHNGDLAHLTPERVWLEVEKALNTASPATFFQSMLACGALSVVLPELANLVGKSQPARYHPEGDAWSHTLEVLNRVSALTNLAPLRFAALMHDIGKSTTPAECLPHHHGHEERGVLLLQDLATRLRIPNNYLKLALLVTAHHGRYRHVPHMRPSSIVKLLVNLSPWQEDSLFNHFLLVCQADLAGREGEEIERGPFLQRCLERCREVTAQPFLQQGLSGAAIGEAITRQRIRLVSQVVKEFFSTTAVKVSPHKCPDRC